MAVETGHEPAYDLPASELPRENTLGFNRWTRRQVCRKCGANDWAVIGSKSNWACRACRKQAQARWKLQIKAECRERYGHECQCCGVMEPRFLTVDHVNDDGADHRRELGRGSIELYAWLKRNGWPDGYQTLCFNCNAGRHLNGGVCPHLEKVEPRK